MSKPAPRILTVIRSVLLTSNMQRITFKGDDLSDFKTKSEGGYIKLLFNENGGADLSDLKEGIRPKRRTYTIRYLRQELNELDVDFVRHHHSADGVNADSGGFASNWSQHAKVGSQISIVGPSSIKGLAKNADWFFLVGDMTALPALSAKLEMLPSSALGYAVIEINHESDKQTLVKPEGISLVWVIKSKVNSEAGGLIEAVRAQHWKSGKVALWSACEFNSMKQLRTYFRNEKAVDKDDIYISSYWKEGCTEDGHKAAKRNDKLTDN